MHAPVPPLTAAAAMFCFVALAITGVAAVPVAYRVSAAERSLSHVVVSPDGSRIAYSSNVGRAVMGADAASGRGAWRVQLPQSPSTSRPAFVGVGDDAVVVVGAQNNRLYALNATTGGSAWDIGVPFSIVSPPTAVVSPQLGTLVVWGGSSDQSVSARNATARGAPSGLWTAGVSDRFTAPVAVALGFPVPAVIAGGERAKVHALRLDTGARLFEWSVLGQVQHAPAVATGTSAAFVVTTGDLLYGLNGVTGGRTFDAVSLRGRPSCAPIVFRPATGASHRVVTGDDSGDIRAFDASSGAEAWAVRGGAGSVAGCTLVQAVDGDAPFSTTLRERLVARGIGSAPIVVCAFSSGLLIAIRGTDGRVVSIAHMNASVAGPPAFAAPSSILAMSLPGEVVGVDGGAWAGLFDVATPWPPGGPVQTKGSAPRAGIIVGAVLGVVVVAGIAAACYVYLRRRQAADDAAAAAGPATDAPGAHELQPVALGGNPRRPDEHGNQPAGEPSQPHGGLLQLPAHSDAELGNDPAEHERDAARDALHAAVRLGDADATREVPWALVRYLTDNFQTKTSEAFNGRTTEAFAAGDVTEGTYKAWSVVVVTNPAAQPAPVPVPPQPVPLYAFAVHPDDAARVAWVVAEPCFVTAASTVEPASARDPVALECAVCFADVAPVRAESELRVAGLYCSHREGRHFVCGDCANRRLAAHFDADRHDIDGVACPLQPCAGTWALEDLAPLLAPATLRRWHALTVNLTQQATHRRVARQRDASEARLREVQHHVRELMRLRCPHCGLAFESFSGCVSVRCGVRGNNVADGHRGCQQLFCGACLTPQPCQRNHGHAFLTSAELREGWARWRRDRVLGYLGGLPPEDAAAVRRLMAADFGAVGVRL